MKNSPIGAIKGEEICSRKVRYAPEKLSQMDRKMDGQTDYYRVSAKQCPNDSIE